MDKTLRLVVVGGPGSGKGTQGQTLATLLQLTHLSTGALFRDHIRRQTELGILAEKYISQGNLVPDQIATQLLRDTLGQLPAPAGFILDGYPRSLTQANDLQSMLEKQQQQLNAVLYLQVSDAEIIRRLSGRLVCSSCQQSFHREFAKPRQEGLCDHCGGELYQRSDDKADTIRERIRVFHEMTEPILSFYQEQQLLLEIKAEGTPLEVKQKVEAIAKTLTIKGP
jgi:adenylate kinase